MPLAKSLPSQTLAFLREGQTLQAQGRHAQAAERYARVQTAAPNAWEGWHFGGMAALLLGQADTAERLLTRAVELNRTATPSALGLGVARIAKGDSAGGEKVLAELTRRHPKLPEAWDYLALALEIQQRFAEAVEARRRYTRLVPRASAGWAQLGTALSGLGRFSEALAAFDEALRLDPAHLRTRLTRAMTLFKCCRVEEAAGEFAAVVASDPAQFEARSCRVMALNYLPAISREQLLAEHRTFGQAAGTAMTQAWPNTRDTARRLRVAFLSPDFCEHSVAYFIEPLLRHLDRAGFEVVLYHDNAKVDAVTERLRGLSDQWRNFATQINEMVESAIRADAPDVLVDLTGHAGTNRLRLFARRLAPVQITYLGYPNTTGVGAMDYRLVDPLTDPAPEADGFATERLVRFAPTAWAYLPPAQAPAVAPPPLLMGETVTFGSFNNSPKITDPILRVWARVLATVPNSRLLIKSAGLDDPAARQPLCARLEAAGLPSNRVELVARTPDSTSHLALYGRVDVALDTFPYHGTTTTCEALWMGVPVVTLVGDRHASRVGLSLLTAVGHSDWAAANEDEYVRVACELVADAKRLAAVRQQLRGDVERSALLDHAGQAQRFGRAVRACWAEWCATRGA